MTDTLRRPTLALVLVIGLALVALALAQGGMRHGAPDSRAAPGAMHGGPGMQGIVDEAGFLTHMIPHHQEAVDSASHLLTLTERPELRTLLQEIVASQSAEIEQMRSWLDRWHPGTEPSEAYVPMMRDLSGESVEVQEQAFLEDMLMHHMMAVRDARMLLAQGLAENQEVADLARSIVSEQTREMLLMQGWLAEWFDVPAMGAMGPGRANGMGMMAGAGTGRMGMNATGMGATGMHGTGMGATGMHATGMGAMRGRAAAEAFDTSVVRALADAFLAGAGGGGEVTDVVGPQVTYRVTFVRGEEAGVLLVDARTGEVQLESER